MKKIILSATIFSIWQISVFTQEATSLSGVKIKDGVVYFTFNDKNLEYFTSEEFPDNRKPVKATATFFLKSHNSCNLYMKWFNPLKYKLAWNDTELDDERDKVIKDFISLLIAQFGPPVSSSLKKSRIRIQMGNDSVISKERSPKLNIPSNGFNYPDLNLLYLELNNNSKSIQSSEIAGINLLTEKMIKLDELNSKDVSGTVDAVFTDLINLDDPEKVPETVATNKMQLDEIYDNFQETELLQEQTKVSLNELQISYELLAKYMKTVITEFITQSTQNLNKNKNLVLRLKPVLEIVERSVLEESLLKKGFFRIRDIEFKDGKKLECTVTITEYRYDKNAKNLIRLEENLKKTLIFQQYDFITPSVSTGLFYATATIKGFGVSNTSEGAFSVTEEDITKSTPVAAVFLNLNFDVKARYFSPLAQIGIDPTKKRPFLLMGIGFSIPVAKIALSGGPVWVWNQHLNSLSVGQAISSTTELEKDIKYTFEVEPKGWYLGIQYNF